MKFTEQDRAALVAEIFEVTGVAVDKYDPVVLCALFQSRTIRDASASLDKAVAGLQDMAAEMGNKTTEAGKSLEAAVAAGFSKANHTLSLAASDAARNEFGKLQPQLAAFADNLKRKMLSGIETDSLPPADSKRVIFGAAIVALFSLFVGATFFGRADPLTPAQRNALEVGQGFMHILPTLDKATKEKLMQALSNQKQSK